jgi:hypothetical protein
MIFYNNHNNKKSRLNQLEIEYLNNFYLNNKNHKKNNIINKKYKKDFKEEFDKIKQKKNIEDDDKIYIENNINDYYKNNNIKDNNLNYTKQILLK